MLFNSPEFLLLFLPCVFGVFLTLRNNTRLTLGWLTCASLTFYAWWEPRYLILLLGSVAVNYSLARVIAATRERPLSRLILSFTIVANLLLLGTYKYTAMAVDTLAHLFDLSLQSPSLVLPLAISFFTLQQIAYQCDVYSGQEPEQGPLKYLLFVSFFPQLIAGPIIHQNQLIPQLNRINALFSWSLVPPAITLIVLGLSKKVLLADSIAVFIDPVFSPQAMDTLSLADAWLATIGYTLQLYFDFSGYCDIALGLALLFGIKLPVNFYSPLKASSIIEFWRLWHMTLSHFLREYVYIPLGGNRKGSLRRGTNLMLTMLIGGLWHGAGWNFVLWGGIHGVLLLVNHSWRSLVGSNAPGSGSLHYILVTRVMTFLSVAVAFVYFRSPTLEVGNAIVLHLVDFQSLQPSGYILQSIQLATANDFSGALISRFGLPLILVLFLGSGLAISQLAPNAIDIVHYRSLPGEATTPTSPASEIHWRHTGLWGSALGILFWMVLLSLTSVSPFIYFQF